MARSCCQAFCQLVHRSNHGGVHADEVRVDWTSICSTGRTSGMSTTLRVTRGQTHDDATMMSKSSSSIDPPVKIRFRVEGMKEGRSHGHTAASYCTHMPHARVVCAPPAVRTSRPVSTGSSIHHPAKILMRDGTRSTTYNVVMPRSNCRASIVRDHASTVQV